MTTSRPPTGETASCILSPLYDSQMNLILSNLYHPELEQRVRVAHTLGKAIRLLRKEEEERNIEMKVTIKKLPDGRYLGRVETNNGIKTVNGATLQDTKRLLLKLWQEVEE